MGTSASKTVRNCIICGADDGEPQFTYTFDFLVRVRGMPAERAKASGWAEDTTSTIVRCRRCGCFYVRDAVLDTEIGEEPERPATAAEIARFLAPRRPGDALASYREHDEEAWIVRSLVNMAARRQAREIRFLDFGAGGATACKTARALGVSEVFAYDPFYAGYIQEIFDLLHGAGVKALRRREQIAANAPFDAVMFQSSVEHVADPKLELTTIREAMAPGGLLYVNNPFMNLARDIGKLKAATKIVKQDRISHYHPWHLNYLTPRQFRDLLEECGFRVTNLALYAPVPAVPALWRDYLKQKAKVAVRVAQNALRLPYDRYVFIVERR